MPRAQLEGPRSELGATPRSQASVGGGDLSPLRRAEISACVLVHRCGTHCNHADMRTVFEAAGGISGLRRLAEAWHHRVMTEDVVSHAFSLGFHPQPVERLAACWRRRSVA